MLEIPLQSGTHEYGGEWVKDKNANFVSAERLIEEYECLVARVAELENEKKTFRDLWQECITVEGCCDECEIRGTCRIEHERMKKEICSK